MTQFAILLLLLFLPNSHPSRPISHHSIPLPPLILLGTALELTPNPVLRVCFFNVNHLPLIDSMERTLPNPLTGQTQTLSVTPPTLIPPLLPLASLILNQTPLFQEDT